MLPQLRRMKCGLLSPGVALTVTEACSVSIAFGRGVIVAVVTASVLELLLLLLLLMVVVFGLRTVRGGAHFATTLSNDSL